MAVISVGGKTKRFGNIKWVKISGTEKVDKIESSDAFFAEIAPDELRLFDGYMANAYYPENGTMLHAYLWLCSLFGEENVKVEGDIGEIPHGDEGALY